MVKDSSSSTGVLPARTTGKMPVLQFAHRISEQALSRCGRLVYLAFAFDVSPIEREFVVMVDGQGFIQ